MTVTTTVTGLGWMGTGIRSVKSALRDILQESRQEVLLCAYSLSGGAGEILDEFENCLKRGIKFTGVVNRFKQQPKEIQDYILSLNSAYNYCNFYDFNHPSEELHAKLVVVDRRIALVGSANISMRGMERNYELGILLKDREVGTIADCIDKMLTFQTVSHLTSPQKF